MGVMEKLGWQGLPAVQSIDNANYSLLTAMKYNLERIIALLDEQGLSGSKTGGALLQSLSEVNSELNGLEASIRVEQLARIQGDEALAQQIQQIIATGDGSNSTYLQADPPTAPPYTLNVGDLWFDSDDDFKLRRWSGSAWAPVDDQRILANTAAISNEQTARITADDALASDITALNSVVNDNHNTLQASIFSEAQTRATADTALGTRVDTLTATVNTNNSTVTARIATEETARATADSAATSRMDTMQASITTNTGAISNNTASITNEQNARVAADNAHTNSINSMNATVTKNTGDIAKTQADIVTEQTARANADSAIGTQLNSLTATVNGQGTSIETLTARIATEETARANADSALSTRVDTVSATVTDQQNQLNITNASIITEQNARASGDAALAQQITTVSTTVDGHTSQITQMFNAVNGIYAEYTLTVQAGGVITGIELISGGGHSDFIVKADNFRIENSAGVPFEVIGGITYIRNAIIQEAAIGTIKLQENATFDFNFSMLDMGGSRPSTAMYTWYPMGYGTGLQEQRITVIAADKASQIVNIATSTIIRGSGSNPDLLYFRVVRLNDGKVLQTFGPMSIRDNQLHAYAFEFYDQGLIANTPLTYELQYYRSDGGPSTWYSSSMRGVVYKR